MWPRQESLQGVNEEWHRKRAEARRTAFSKFEFGPIEREKYDLDTAGITGEDNPRSYTVNRPINGEDGNMNNGTDVRTLDRK
jgi:hypothetical protein